MERCATGLACCVLEPDEAWLASFTAAFSGLPSTIAISTSYSSFTVNGSGLHTANAGSISFELVAEAAPEGGHTEYLLMSLSPLYALFFSGPDLTLMTFCPCGVTGQMVSSSRHACATSLLLAEGDADMCEANEFTLQTGASGLSGCVIVVAIGETMLRSNALCIDCSFFTSCSTMLAVPACKLLLFINSLENTTPMPATMVATPSQYKLTLQASRFSKSNKTTDPDTAPATIMEPS
mmetsp:Transcript_26845/g.49354  ORF Transcript_26845/g.49354 Transcript_26845/m.49354 type:complete len:237 (-) Transcript_26845:813-1523(-)